MGLPSKLVIGDIIDFQQPHPVKYLTGGKERNLFRDFPERFGFSIKLYQISNIKSKPVIQEVDGEYNIQTDTIVYNISIPKTPGVYKVIYRFSILPGIPSRLARMGWSNTEEFSASAFTSIGTIDSVVLPAPPDGIGFDYLAETIQRAYPAFWMPSEIPDPEGFNEIGAFFPLDLLDIGVYIPAGPLTIDRVEGRYWRTGNPQRLLAGYFPKSYTITVPDSYNVEHDPTAVEPTVVTTYLLGYTLVISEADARISSNLAKDIETVEKIREVIESRLDGRGDISSYLIGGRQVTTISTDELMRLMRKFEERIVYALHPNKSYYKARL